jgi:putative ABC transport system ATP-binding protein
VIRVEGLTRVYPGQGGAAPRPPALRDVSLAVGAGEFVAVVGRSGSGKTTLLNVLGGLDRHWTGRVEVAGKDLAGLADADLSELRNRRLGFVFQAFHLLPHLTVVENVTLPAWFGGDRERATAVDRAREALDRVGLLDRAGDVPTRLSAGERQRVAVARAILNRPAVLLCDEPTGNLDHATGTAVLDLLVGLGREGTTLLVATHEPRVSEAAARSVVLEAGRVVG